MRLRGRGDSPWPVALRLRADFVAQPEDRDDPVDLLAGQRRRVLGELLACLLQRIQDVRFVRCHIDDCSDGRPLASCHRRLSGRCSHDY